MARMAPDNSQPSDANMILVMGVTGSGKSYFINQLVGREVVVESDQLDSCRSNYQLHSSHILIGNGGTAVCTAVPVEIGQSKVLLIDTPGFDDSKRSDTEILTEISKLLAAQYKLGVSLKGVIYLHRITDNRYQGSSVRTVNIFKEICGTSSLRNVILASTRWDKVTESEGASRENRLREHFWSYMISHGSTMTRYYGDRDSAVGMVSQLLGSSNIVLDLQRQLVDEGRTLDQTSAGALINGDLTKHIVQSKAEIDSLRRQLRETNQAMAEKVEEDRRRQEVILYQQETDQVRLRADIAAEVRDEINIEMARTKKKSSKLGLVLPLLPAALSILGMFFGIPSSVTGLFTSWMGIGENGQDLFSETFSNF
jgi:GTP-binding protein EngB required for normal cell division